LLEDYRLTRSGLFSLLTRIGANRNHVFIDACKSYFLVFDRGPGGRRSRYDGTPLARALPAHLTNTGYVLSTSSDRESHEWERYQAGIVSHELRSALRGAADLDLDRRITYAELGAFLDKANEQIIPRFRPDVFVRPPAGDLAHEVLAWDRQPTVALPDRAWGHVYVETAAGERILDMHRSGGALLWVPPERPLFVRRQDESQEYVIDGPFAQLEPERGRAPAVRRKGAIHLAFEELFAAPLSQQDIVRHSLRPASVAAMALDEAQVDAPADDRRALVDGPAKGARKRGRRVATWVGGAVGLAALGSGVGLLMRALALDRQSDAAVVRARADPTAVEQQQLALDRYDQAVSMRRSGLIVGGVGAASVVATLYLWLSTPDR
jgi:hypothetical protein